MRFVFEAMEGFMKFMGMMAYISIGLSKPQVIDKKTFFERIMHMGGLSIGFSCISTYENSNKGYRHISK